MNPIDDIETPNIRVREMRKKMALTRWGCMDLKHRADAVARFFLRHATGAKAIDQIIKYNPMGPETAIIVENMLESMANDYAETFGTDAPWKNSDT